MYKRNYSFSEDSFRDDVSIQNFNNNFEDVNDDDDDDDHHHHHRF